MSVTLQINIVIAGPGQIDRHCGQIVLFGPPLYHVQGGHRCGKEKSRGRDEARCRGGLLVCLRMVPEWDLNCHASRTIMREGKEEKRRENRSYIYL